MFAERWTPLILRELLRNSHRFSDLQRGLPGMSQSLLSQRLRSLEREGIIERRPAAGGRGREYHLTPAGAELSELVELLGAWGYRWRIDRLNAKDVNPESVMLFLRRSIAVDRLPPRRVVIRFDFSDGRRRTWWLVLARPEIDLCPTDPGFEVDLYVTANTMALAEALLARRDLRQAIRAELVRVEGGRDLARAFPDWINAPYYARYGRPPDIYPAGATPRPAGDQIVSGRAPGIGTTATP